MGTIGKQRGDERGPTPLFLYQTSLFARPALLSDRPTDCEHGGLEQANLPKENWIFHTKVKLRYLILLLKSLR